ncbi:hypothetical protein QBC44DRAFT_121756 [Cladorrhinum sp. PSN332]|nr:hypothetical protein QBC44DRAFT_121756 [Cladorrhinum sp. PSN332]
MTMDMTTTSERSDSWVGGFILWGLSTYPYLLVQYPLMGFIGGRLAMIYIFFEHFLHHIDWSFGSRPKKREAWDSMLIDLFSDGGVGAFFFSFFFFGVMGAFISGLVRKPARGWRVNSVIFWYGMDGVGP